ncbi:MAG: Zn-dependent oligopeptidase [Deltaproteobacteria bacterium]|nr:Zn-dependent oligopeptidase [Deltaproteobacteria bacterium]
MRRILLLSPSAALLALAGCASQPAPDPVPTPPPEAPAVAVPVAPALPAAPVRPEAAMWADKAAVKAHCTYASLEAERLRAMIKAGKERNDTATLDPFNRMAFTLDTALGTTGLVAATHPDKEVRTEAETCEQELRKLVSEITLDRGLYDAVSAVDTTVLDGGAQRFVEKTLRDFRRSGVDKDDETRARLKAINEEMVKVGQDFSRAIREGSRKIEVTKKDLAGLPEDFIKAHAPDKDGKITLSTDYPDFFPIENYAKSEDVRRRLYVEFLNRGYPENDANLKRLLELRQEYAGLLGFKTWADYMAEDKMAKSAATIDSFIEEVNKVARPRMEADLKVLLARKKKDDKKAKQVEVWDRFYYVLKVQKEKYGFDAQAARNYFEFNAVTKGLMDLYGELFGVRFERDETAKVWDPSVSAWKMYEGDKLVGGFFLDMHPRDGKYQHAAMFPIRSGLAGGEIPLASLVCNFPDPSKSEGPALMEHGDVTTYFHEFGHLVHHLLATGSKWTNQAGITAEWDFVEAPSQLLEEWAWEPAVLARFAKHVKTGQPIPADLVKKMRASDEFGKGVHVMRQVYYTALSFYLHQADAKAVDLLAFQKDMQTRFSPYPYVEGTHGYDNFGHLEGYSSMYYTYQWSLTLAKDIFTRFEQAGLLDKDVAKDYVNKILRPGGSKDANELVKDFLGREPNLEAYRAWLQAK